MLMQENLLRMYADRGYWIRTGCSLAMDNDIMAEFTGIWKDSKRLDTGWGMSFTELAVMEFLSKIWSPERVFCIGTAFGWSTVALRLCFPHAQLAGVDAGIEGDDNLAGIRLTNDMLSGIGGEILHGYSPQAVPAAVEGKLDGKINLAFIDGLHTPQQQELDFRAVQPYLDRDHVVLFHDVRFCNMIDGFNLIGREFPGRAHLLDRTTSGIGIAYSVTMKHRMERLVNLFSQEPFPG
jgi:hypothetical protein